MGQFRCKMCSYSCPRFSTGRRHLALVHKLDNEEILNVINSVKKELQKFIFCHLCKNHVRIATIKGVEGHIYQQHKIRGKQAGLDIKLLLTNNKLKLDFTPKASTMQPKVTYEAGSENVEEGRSIETCLQVTCKISLPENKFEMKLFNDSAPEEENASKKPRLDLTEQPSSSLNSDMIEPSAMLNDGPRENHRLSPLLEETENTSILDEVEYLFKDIVSPRSDSSLSLEEPFLLRLEESDESDLKDTKKEQSVTISSEKNKLTSSTSHSKYVVTEDPLYSNKKLKDVSSDNGSLDDDDIHLKSFNATKSVSVSESELIQTVGGDPDKEEESISSTSEKSKSKLSTFQTASSNGEKISSNSTPCSDGKQWIEEKLVDSNNSSRQKSTSSLSKNGTKSTLTFKDALKSLVNEERLVNSSSPKPLQPTVEISGDFPLAKEASSFTVLESKPNQGVKRPLKSKEKGDSKKFRHVPAHDEHISEESVESGKSEVKSGKSEMKSIKNLRRIRRKMGQFRCKMCSYSCPRFSTGRRHLALVHKLDNEEILNVINSVKKELQNFIFCHLCKNHVRIATIKGVEGHIYQHKIRGKQAGIDIKLLLTNNKLKLDFTPKASTMQPKVTYKAGSENVEEGRSIKTCLQGTCKISLPENKFEMKLLNDSAPEEENASKKPRLDLTEQPSSSSLNSDIIEPSAMLNNGPRENHRLSPLLKETENTSILDEVEYLFKDIVSPKSDSSLSLEEPLLLRLEESDESDLKDTKKEQSVTISSEKNKLTSSTSHSKYVVTEDPLYSNKKLKDVSSDNGSLDDDDIYSKSFNATKSVSVSESELIQTVGGDPDKEEESISSTSEKSKSKLTTFQTASSNSEKSPSNSTPSSDGKQWTEEKLVDSNNSSRQKSTSSLSKNGTKSTLTFKDALKSLVNEERLLNSSSPQPLQPTVEISGDFPLPKEASSFTVLESKPNQGIKRPLKGKEKEDSKKFRHVPAQDELISEEYVESGKSEVESGKSEMKSIKNLRRIRRKMGQFRCKMCSYSCPRFSTGRRHLALVHKLDNEEILNVINSVKKELQKFIFCHLCKNHVRIATIKGVEGHIYQHKIRGKQAGLDIKLLLTNNKLKLDFTPKASTMQPKVTYKAGSENVEEGRSIKTCLQKGSCIYGKQWIEGKLGDSNHSSRQKSTSSLSKNGTKSTLTFKDALKSLVNEERLLNSSSPQPLQPTAEISGDFPLPKEASSFTVLESKPNQGIKRPLKGKEKGDSKKFRHVPAQDELISEEYVESGKSEVESGKSEMKSIKNLRRIRRKDLENLVLELFMDKVLYEHEMGNQRDLCKRLETTLEANRKKAEQFHKEIENFKKVTQRLQAEHTNRKCQLVTPVKVKRSVGIISKGIMHARTVSSAMKTIAPRINSATSPSTQFRSNVVTSPPNPTLSPKAAIIPPKTMKLQDFSIRNRKQSKHPAPLPNTSIQQIAGISKKLPPLPLLKLIKKNNNIVLSWNMAKTEEHEAISSYQLYGYPEGSTPPTSSLWKKIGRVKALELPMACTLTQFMPGHVYHFAVRAVDIRSRMGPFSIPRSIRLGQ